MSCPPGSRITAVIIDPNVLLTESLKEGISNHPVIKEFHASATCDEGLRLVANVRADLLIASERIFVEGGLIPSKLPSRIRRLRVGVFADDLSEASLSQALDSNVTGFFSKRCSFDELVNGVVQLASGQFYIAPPLHDRITVPEGSSRPVLSLKCLDSLTRQQRLILPLLVEGLSAREIADRLQVSEKAIESHKFRIMSRLGVSSRVQLCRWAIREGLIEP